VGEIVEVDDIGRVLSAFEFVMIPWSFWDNE
jgi:hypothetical protein